jgi:hypothetical protein
MSNETYAAPVYSGTRHVHILQQATAETIFTYRVLDGSYAVTKVRHTTISVPAARQEMKLSAISSENSAPPQAGFVLALAECGVVVTDWAGVNGYLIKHQDMYDLVGELCRVMRIGFPRPATLVLKLNSDPEFNDEHLALYVRLHEYGSDVLEQIEGCYLTLSKELSRASGWIVATTDFAVG